LEWQRQLLQESLEVVQRTAAVIFDGIAPRPQETELTQEPEAVTPEPQPQMESAAYVPQPAVAEAVEASPF